MSNATVIAIRALLKKEGSPDVRLEVQRSSSMDFAIVVNGAPKGVIWRQLSQNPSDRSKPFLIEDAFRSVLAKSYPGYTATEVEEGSDA